jgi:hypothetical protein
MKKSHFKHLVFEFDIITERMVRLDRYGSCIVIQFHRPINQTTLSILNKRLAKERLSLERHTASKPDIYQLWDFARYGYGRHLDLVLDGINRNKIFELHEDQLYENRKSLDFKKEFKKCLLN